MTNVSLKPSNFKQLENHIIDLYENIDKSQVVQKKFQEEEIKSINKTIGSQRFYFSVNLFNFEIENIGGVNQWLGYNEKEFTLNKYWSIIHPGNQITSHTIFLHLIDFMSRGQFKLGFMVQRYSSLTALRHKNGDYYLTKRIASVFQYNAKNQLTEYLNEFTIIGKYNGEPLLPFFFKNNGEYEQENGEKVMKKVLESFLSLKIFSYQELQIARIMAYNAGITQKEIASSELKSINTIDTFCKRLLTKARNYFRLDFSSTDEVAAYLKESGLI